MTHELKKIVEAYEKGLKKDLKSVLATVVALDGSSYRRPGVRMLIQNDGTMVGAVSGGCVEKEIYRQSLLVFKTHIPKVMTYDGRLRLGCEGVLYILLEPFEPDVAVLSQFWSLITQRVSFTIVSYFEKAHGQNDAYGSFIQYKEQKLFFRAVAIQKRQDLKHFSQVMLPCFRLVIIGTEHDAVQMCAMAALLGWEVTVVAHPKEEKTAHDFPKATHFINKEMEILFLKMDNQMAVVLMTHSFVKDLQFLMNHYDQCPAYFGVLGPAQRREKLFHELLELRPDIDFKFMESIYGPVGLDLGAETPQEIALSVLAEIMAVTNQKDLISLRKKTGRIHS